MILDEILDEMAAERSERAAMLAASGFTVDTSSTPPPPAPGGPSSMPPVPHT